MIIDNDKAIEYLVKPIDAVDPTITVNGSKVTLDFTIEENCDYVVVIKDVKDTSGNALDQPLVYSFTSLYSPLYATINQISSDIGTSDAPLDDIYKVIRSNSIDVQYLTTKTIDWNNPPYEVKQYVRYQSDVDLVLNQYSEMAAQASDQFQLGDFSATVGRGSTTAYKAVLGELQKRADYWRKRLLGGSASKPQSYVKGGADWPDYLKRTF